MTIHRTPKGITEDLQALCGEQLRAFARDTGQSLAMIAAAVGRDPSTVEDWTNSGKPLPVYALAHPNVSRSLRASYIAWLLQRLESDTPNTTVEQATSDLLRIAGEVLMTVAPMLADGRIDTDEKRVLVPLMRRLHRTVGNWLAQHGDDEVSK